MEPDESGVRAADGWAAGGQPSCERAARSLDAGRPLSARTAGMHSAPQPRKPGGFGAWWRELVADARGLCMSELPVLLASAAVIIANYFHLLASGSIGIDTETMVNVPGTILNWYGIGREGMVLSKYALGTLHFNMYWAKGLGIALLLTSLWLWCFLLWRLGARRRGTYLLFCLLFATHPLFVEQFYFTTQIAEFNLAMCMVPLALLAIVESSAAPSSPVRALGGTLACLLMLWAFASYQSFMALALAGGALVGLVLALPRRRGWRGAPDAARPRPQVGAAAASFAASYAVAAIAYVAITRTWFSSSDYLTGQVQWGVLSVPECLARIGRVARDMALGDQTFYTAAFAIAAVLLAVRVALDLAGARAARRPGVPGRRGGLTALAIACCLLLLASPFLLPVAMANAPAVRTAFTLPFATAASAAVFWEGAPARRPSARLATRLAAMVVAGALVCSQVATSQRLLYTDDVAERQSMELATVLCHDIDVTLGGQQKPVVFVGCWDPELDASCLKGEYIGTTEFHWGDASLPHYHRSTEIVENWLQALGHTYEHPTEAQVIEARKLAHSMGRYADTGEVRDAGDFLVVKLGPDLFYSQDIAPLGA